jgi:hypothetical protein
METSGEFKNTEPILSSPDRKGDVRMAKISVHEYVYLLILCLM